MVMGIDNYYFNNFDGELTNSGYWDFHLTSDNQGQTLPYVTSCDDVCFDKSIIQDGLVMWFDVDNSGSTTNGETLISLTEWCDNVIEPNSGITLHNFGLTGVDNGRVSGLTDTLFLSSGDTKVKLYPVTGETYEYPWSYEDNTLVGSGCDMGKSICLNGGFYQGFFKIDFEKPSPITSTTITTNNCGDDITGYTTTKGDPESEKYDLLPTKFDKGWTMETWVLPNSCGVNTGNTLNNTYTGNTGFFFYIGTRAENKFWNVFSGESGHTTYDGISLQPNIEVDEGLNGGQDWFSISNPKLLGARNSNSLSCCCDTPTTDSTSTGGTSNFCSELGENSLGFRITDDNRIGWRKITVDGDCINNGMVITGETIEQSYTEKPVIPTGNTPTLIQVVYTEDGGQKFGLPTGSLKMFVNGRLVLNSKEFIGLQLRALNEWSEKQEGVPYNISWGGGSQGLLETKTFGGPDNEDKGLFIENNFTGTFNGKLSQLRFYKKPLNILELRNNLFFDCDKYCVTESFGGLNVCKGDQPIDRYEKIIYGKSNNVVFTNDLMNTFHIKDKKTTIEEGLELNFEYGFVYFLIPKNSKKVNIIRFGEYCDSNSFSIPFNILGDLTVIEPDGFSDEYTVYRSYNPTNYLGKVWLCDLEM